MAVAAADAEGLRGELRDLFEKRRRGELRERDFQKKSTLRTVELYGAVVSRRLARGEAILCEHHALRGHFRWNQSLLREPEQQAESLFLTERRLLRLRSQLHPDRPVSCDRQDETRIDEVPLARVRGLRVRRDVRTGEAIAGVLIIAVAILAGPLLLITGKMMIGLGALGVLHALLLPTRWVEVETGGEPIPVLAARRKSGRVLLRKLRQLLGAGHAG